MDIGKLIGGAAIVGATVAIWLWPDSKRPQDGVEPTRPIRSMEVRSTTRMPDLSFEGTVKANENRNLAFKQSGRIARIPVVKGQAVKKGDVLAWLDPLDFSNRLSQAEAAYKHELLSYQRKSEAVKKNAISQQEVSLAEATLKRCEAEFELAKRALDETKLLAPFDGTVADIHSDELDIVSVTDPIVRVQDLSRVKVDVVYPENLVIIGRRIKTVDSCSNCTVEVTFDSVPGRAFAASFVEFQATADVKTQTYLATYVMNAPKDLLLLPGMSVTIHLKGDRYQLKGELDVARKITVPESAVGVDSAGVYFVWKLEKSATEGVYAVRKTPVSVGHNIGKDVIVEKGISEGDRIATAGVSVLTEGRLVSLIAE